MHTLNDQYSRIILLPFLFAGVFGFALSADAQVASVIYVNPTRTTANTNWQFGNGSSPCTAAQLWSCVNDAPGDAATSNDPPPAPDYETTEIRTAAGVQTGEIVFGSASGIVPAGSTNISIERIYVVSKGSSDDVDGTTFRPFYRIGSGPKIYVWTSSVGVNRWYFEWSLIFREPQPLTEAQLNQIEIGVDLIPGITSQKQIFLSRIMAGIQYTPPAVQPNNASFVSQTAPPSAMAAGQTANVSVTMQNTGTNTWTPAGGYRLGSQSPQDNTNWGMNRDNLEVASVAPGSSATFNFTVTAPSTPGTYNFQWRMVQDGIEWFGANSTNVSVTVTAPPDTTPPAPPTTVNFGSATPNSLTASWSGASDNVAITGYRLDVSTSAAFVSFVPGYNNLDIGNVTSRVVSGLSPSTTYYTRVRAYDAAGNISVNSVTANGTTLAPPPSPNVSGYAWAGSGADDGTNSNPSIGWISLLGTALDGLSYGVAVSAANPGVLSGYAWANPNDAGTNNIGWISFNETELAGCPSGTCRAELNRTTGAVTGWARACSVFQFGCSGAVRSSPELGGWDGWIHLSGVGYGVAVSGCNWSGYAWGGGTNIGWIHFGGALYPTTGSGNGCTTSADLTVGSVLPLAAVAGEPTTFSATVSNGGIGSTGSGFTNLFQRANDAFGGGATDIGTHTQSTALSPGANATVSLSYAFPSSGTYYLRVCADKSSAGDTGTIAESNESNNCGLWTEVTVALPELTGTFSASPDSIDPGGSSTLTWTSNATSCIGTGFSTGGAASGSVSTGPLASSQNYQVTCSKSGYDDLTLATTVTVISITASISAKPSCVTGGGTSKIAWSVLPVTQIQAGSCRLSGPGLSSSPLSVSPDGSAPNASPQTATVPGSKSTYTISCTTTGGASITKSATIDITNCWAEF